MTLRDDLLAEKARIERDLVIVDRAGEDTFPLGTITLFAMGSQKAYFLKVAEESWRSMASSTPTRQLREIILEWENYGGYFEIYKLLPEATPFYTSLST
jgi:hypothetical protein